MGGTSKQEQQTSQQSSGTTAPWQPAQGALQGILGGINSQLGNINPNGAEQGALNTIQNNAAGTQNYAPQAQGLANNLMSGGPDRTGILGGAYSNLQQGMQPYTNANYLDPTQSPGMAKVLETIRNDVGNSVNGMFAGAGRDMSGMNQQALARGIAQGEAQPLLQQYNQNVAAQQGAMGQLFNAGQGTAQGLMGMDQQRFANQAQGLDVGINGVQQAQNAGANNILQAQQMQRQFPIQNLGMLSGLTIPIAALGSQTSGQMTGQTTGSNTMSGAQQAWGWMNAGSNMMKNFRFGGPGGGE